jgi:hypothetical protein
MGAKPIGLPFADLQHITAQRRIFGHVGVRGIIIFAR